MLFYARSQALIFKGGTALRLVYRGVRCSEDLDFSALISEEPVAAVARIAELRGLWQVVVAGLRDFGAEGEIRNVWEGMVGFSFDVRPFVVTVLTPEHLLAEKVRALLVRARPRDVHDVWLMVEQGVRLDVDLIGQKLQLVEMALTPAVVEGALARARADWERDLRPFLGQYVEPDVTDRAAATLLRLAQD